MRNKLIKKFGAWLNYMATLITGGSGILGTELKKLFPNSLTPTHMELDVTNKKKLVDYIRSNEIDLVIHAAACTSIRFCEENKEVAWKTNVEGTKNLIDAITEVKSNIRIIYVSTACVFDGHTGMYKESSIPYPENFYGLTKLLAESEVRKVGNHLIIRTNFVGKRKWSYPKAFTDRFGTYLFANDVARGILDIEKNNLDGFVHIVGDKKMSMFELAKLTTPEVQPMTINEYSGPRLTMDMSLDTERWKKYQISSTN